MNTKLTLTIDESVIKEAKAYAEEQGRSLSAVVENYLKLVIKKKEDVELTPILKSILNDLPKIELPKDYDYKKELDKVREKKYQKYLKNE